MELDLYVYPTLKKPFRQHWLSSQLNVCTYFKSLHRRLQHTPNQEHWPLRTTCATPALYRYITLKKIPCAYRRPTPCGCSSYQRSTGEILQLQVYSRPISSLLHQIYVKSTHLDAKFQFDSVRLRTQLNLCCGEKLKEISTYQMLKKVQILIFFTFRFDLFVLNFHRIVAGVYRYLHYWNCVSVFR